MAVVAAAPATTISNRPIPPALVEPRRKQTYVVIRRTAGPQSFRMSSGSLVSIRTGGA